MREWSKRLESWDAQLAALGVTSEAAQAARAEATRESASSRVSELQTLLKPRIAARSRTLPAHSEPAGETSLSAEHVGLEPGLEAESVAVAERSPINESEAEEPRAPQAEDEPEVESVEPAVAVESQPEGVEAVAEESASLAQEVDSAQVEPGFEPPDDLSDNFSESSDAPSPVALMKETAAIEEVLSTPASPRDSGVQRTAEVESVESPANDSDDEMLLEDEIEFEELLVEGTWQDEEGSAMRGSALPPPPPPSMSTAGSAENDVDEFSGLMELDARRNLGFGDLTPHMVTPSPDIDSNQTQ